MAYREFIMSLIRIYEICQACRAGHGRKRPRKNAGVLWPCVIRVLHTFYCSRAPALLPPNLGQLHHEPWPNPDSSAVHCIFIGKVPRAVRHDRVGFRERRVHGCYPMM